MILPPQTLAIIHDCTVVSPAELESFTVALQFAFDEHFDLIWNTRTAVVFVEPGGHIPDGSWQIWVRDDPPPAEADDLGYHTKTGEPIAYVYARASMAEGTPWSVPLSHEGVEMRNNPNTNLTAPLVRGGVIGLTAKEACDACQDPRYAVEYEGLNGDRWRITACLTPAYFDPAGTAPFSYPPVPEIDGPGKLAPGGYLPWEPTGGAWQQIFADEAGPLQRKRAGSRYDRICGTDSGLSGAAGGL
jgi:hypothetical protein